MASTPLFRGTAPALVTPFTRDGDLDLYAFRRLIDRQIDGGVAALVVLGTTGENPTVTDDERQALTDAALDQADGRVPVIIGTGTNNTAASATYSRWAADAGADGLLIVGPYYNKPTPEGYVRHVAAVAEATDCPILVYNVPGRTGGNIDAETMLRIADEVPTVVGVKEASGDLAQIADLLAGRPEGLAVYSGDDEITLPLLALGGDGVVSVLANALPERFCRMVGAALDGDLETARAEHFALLPAMRACFHETNPAPVKTALADAGQMEERFRLPMVPMQDAARRHVLDVFRPLMASG